LEGSILILMKLGELESKRVGDTYLYNSYPSLESSRGDSQSPIPA
jgi:hypothetical protein